MRLSDRGTLLLHVDSSTLALRPELTVDGVTFRPKVEHHVTVFGFKIGKLVKKACAEVKGLEAALNEAVATIDWGVTPTDRYFRLVRDELHTIVVLVEAPGVARFFAAARELVPEAQVELRAALQALPPPHVTLYTSDPAGAAGIGLNTVREFEDARGRAERGETSGLRAISLDARSIRG